MVTAFVLVHALIEHKTESILQI